MDHDMVNGFITKRRIWMDIGRSWLGRTPGCTRCNDRMWLMITALYPRTPSGNTVIEFLEPDYLETTLIRAVVHFEHA